MASFRRIRCEIGFRDRGTTGNGGWLDNTVGRVRLAPHHPEKRAHDRGDEDRATAEQYRLAKPRTAGRVDTAERAVESVIDRRRVEGVATSHVTQDHGVTGGAQPLLETLAVLDAAPEGMVNRPGIIGDVLGRGDLAVLVLPGSCAGSARTGPSFLSTVSVRRRMAYSDTRI